MRSILDVHEYIKCGTETRILPQKLTFLKEYLKSNKNKTIEILKRDIKYIYDASALFIYQILNSNLKKSSILCAKDPGLLQSIDLFNTILPNTKFLIMIRDPRGAVLSFLNKMNVKMSEEIFLKHLSRWNTLYEEALKVCNLFDKAKCKIVKYENLILNPKKSMKQVSNFLNIEYTDKFLRHNEFIGDRIVLEKNHWSSGQVNRSIYDDSLTSWIGKVKYNKTWVNENIYMMHIFGYKINFDDPNDGNFI